MMLLAWIACSTVAVVGLGLAAVTVRGGRRHAGLLVMAVAVGGMLVALGADVFAALWFLLILPLCVVGSWPEPDVPPLLAAGPRLAAGVLVGVLWGALAYVGQRVDWYALPAGGFEAQAAMLAGRLLSVDLVIALGLLLMALALLVGRRGVRAEADADLLHDQRGGTTR